MKTAQVTGGAMAAKGLTCCGHKESHVAPWQLMAATGQTCSATQEEI